MHLVILLFGLFASLFTLQKEALSVSEPFFLVGSRMLFAGVLLCSHQLFFSGKQFHFKASHIKPLALLALSNIYLTNIFEIWGLNHMVSSKACLIYSLSPFLAALVAYVILKEKLSAKKWLGMLIGFFGLMPILYMQTSDEIASGTIGVFTLAELSIVGAVVCSVYGWIQLKKVISDYDYSPLLANGISMTIGGVLALFHSYFAGESWTPVPVTGMGTFMTLTMTMCIISNLICYNLYGHLLKRFSATFMSFSGLVTPLFASLFGWILLNETVTWHFFASIACFSLGLTIFYIEELKAKPEGKKDKQLTTEVQT